MPFVQVNTVCRVGSVTIFDHISLGGFFFFLISWKCISGLTVIESESLMYCYMDDCHCMIFVLLYEVYLFLNLDLIVSFFSFCFNSNHKAIMMRTEVSYLLEIFVCGSVD